MQDTCYKLFIRRRFLSLFIVTMIISYRYTLSYFIGRQCRFAPSCSEYMIEAVVTYGLWHGVIKGIKRILRCHPWGGSGFDPVKK